MHCCPYCWHPLDELTAGNHCPRCGYRETIGGQVTPPRHCGTCTCQAEPAAVPAGTSSKIEARLREIAIERWADERLAELGQ
jgi:hypothetical protein